MGSLMQAVLHLNICTFKAIYGALNESRQTGLSAFQPPVDCVPRKRQTASFQVLCHLHLII